MPAYIETMAYRGALPWHGIGEHVTETERCDSAAFFQRAQLGWEAVKAPAFYLDPNISAGLHYHEIPGQFTILRSDSGKSLGCTVGKKYEAFQNDELRALGDALCKTGEARWETAGSLHGGRLVWGLAQVAGAIEIKRRDGSLDTHGSYLLLNNTHDGSSLLRAMFTDVRVVCANTNGWALGVNDKKRRAAKRAGTEDIEDIEVLGRSFTSPHTSGIHDRAQEAQEALGIAVAARDEHRETLQELANTPMDMPAFGTFCAQLLTGFDDPKEAVERVVEIDKAGGRSATIIDNKAAQLAQLFADYDQGNRGESRKDAFDGLTDWIDHQRNRIAVHRTTADRLGIASKSMASSQFGTGADLKRRGLKLLTS